MRHHFYKYLTTLSKFFGPWLFALVSRGIATGYFLFSPRSAASARFYRVLFRPRPLVRLVVRLAPVPELHHRVPGPLPAPRPGRHRLYLRRTGASHRSRRPGPWRHPAHVPYGQLGSRRPPAAPQHPRPAPDALHGPQPPKNRSSACKKKTWPPAASASWPPTPKAARPSISSKGPPSSNPAGSSPWPATRLATRSADGLPSAF